MWQTVELTTGKRDNRLFEPLAASIVDRTDSLVMNREQPISARLILSILACLLILKICLSVAWNVPDYFPPHFQSEFLHGREAYFWEGYHWAFYAHIVSGPVSLIQGMILLNQSVRRRFPSWHRVLGRVQVVLVLLVVSPSGLAMAFYAAAGEIAGLGFGTLAVATGACVVLGWRAAVRWRFADHQRWMSRCYLLLCSAVVIRLMGGLGIVTGYHADWVDPASAWLCWFVPLAVFEVLQSKRRWLQVR